MKRYQSYFFFTGILTFLLEIFGCRPGQDANPPQNPNIIFIMADDLGIGDLGCYNPESKIKTPNIDSLAIKGIRFSNAHAPSAVCSPTRYGVLTGRYAWRTRLKKGGVSPYEPLLIDTARMTVGDILKAQGYHTGLVGKWHLGLTLKDRVDYLADSLYPGPPELGFDYFFGLPGSLNMSPFCFVEGHHTVGIPNIPKPPEIYGTPGNMVAGWRHEDVGPTLTRKAVDFIKEHADNMPGTPFCLHLLTSAPHRPCIPPDFLKGKSQAGPRGDMVMEVDWTVGEVVKTLRELGMFENTMIVITSDNGAIPGLQPDHGTGHIPVWEMYGHKSMMDWRGYKTHIWEGGHRVPFIVCWPGWVSPGTRSDELICLTDWMATLAAYFNMELPENAGEDSYNILPAILGQAYEKPIREALVTHSMLGVFAIQKGDWKLIEGTGHGGESDRVFEPVDLEGNPGGQLYNVKDDPHETDNLWNEHPEIVEELSSLLDKYKNNGRSNY